MALDLPTGEDGLRLADSHPPEHIAALTRPERAAKAITSLAAAATAGDRLGTKDELRIFCGVSVGTFNEALRLVQARGVVTVRSGPGGGLFASRQSLQVRLGNSMLALDDDATSVADAVRLRDALDPLLVRDALRHAAAGDIAAMRAELVHMRAAAERLDGIAFVRANWALHARIADVTPNALLRTFYTSLLDVIETHTLSVLPDDEHPLPDFIRSRYELHAVLVDSIDAREHTRAMELIHEHNTTANYPVDNSDSSFARLSGA